MVMLNSCWSPFIWSDNLKTGCKGIAFYTIAISIVLMTFVCFDMDGGDSTQLYNPLFEADIKFSMLVVGGFILVYFLYMIFASCCLFVALNNTCRGFLLFWLVGFAVAIIFQLIFGLWLLGGYYIYLECVLYTFIIWIWMAYHIYLWLVVYSQYKVFAKMQSPNIELLWP